MQRLVEDLLDASSLRGGALRVHRAPGVAGTPFDDAARMLRPLAEAAGLVLDVEGGGPETPVAIDAPRVVQLLSNLVGNAIKFTPAGGAVRVRWSVEPATEAHVGALVGSVADTGPGIAADELPHLFTAFWRGDRRARRGVGLGLWIARAIAEAHGGELRVESSPGAGTTFHFTLPFADAARRRED
jgi:signal transduction histidine kinase